MQLIVLIRHPQANKNVNPTFGGNAESDTITNFGVNEMRCLIAHLSKVLMPNYKYAIYSGTSQRVHCPAQTLAVLLNCKHFTDKRLDAINNGQLAGASEKEISINFPDYWNMLCLYRKGILNSYNISHLGESLIDFEKRIESFLVMTEAHENNIGFLFAHRSVCTATLIHYARKFYGYIEFPTCSISIIDIEHHAIPFVSKPLEQISDVTAWVSLRLGAI
jgi:broad specificity phosphatase PhoE